MFTHNVYEKSSTLVRVLQFVLYEHVRMRWKKWYICHISVYGVKNHLTSR